MLRNSRTAVTDHAIFGDEEAAALRAELSDLRRIVSDLTAQVQAQFTSIATHAEIARTQGEFIREEAHANLERTRETLIDLLEQVRRDAGDLHFGPAVGGTRAPGPWAPPGPSAMLTAERVTALETQVSRAMATVEHCSARQQELADTMAAFLDTMIYEARNEPVAALRLA